MSHIDKAIQIDPALDKYDNVVLFLELLAKAETNALLEGAGPPKFSASKSGFHE